MNAYDELPNAARQLMVEYGELEIADMCARAQARVDELKAEVERLHQAQLNQPVLRHCVYPGCLCEFDINASLAGNPTRPSWSSDGWFQIKQLSAHICPEHSDLVIVDGLSGSHLPRWQRGEETTLVCACGWESGRIRWRGYGIEAWKDHLLTIKEGLWPTSGRA